MQNDFSGDWKPSYDAELAWLLIRDIGEHCWHGKGEMQRRVHEAIKSHLPPQYAKRWSWRRVRSLWNREASSVRFTEIMQLAAVEAATTTSRSPRHANAVLRKVLSDLVPEMTGD